MRIVRIKDVEIGAGAPKIVVPLAGTGKVALLEQARRGIAAGADCFEYRADYADDPHDARGLVSTSRMLADALPDHPLLFTFRTAGQGGAAHLGTGDLEALYNLLIAEHAADILDVEAQLQDEAVRRVCAAARRAGMATVVSHHDFQATPSEDDMVRMLLHFDELGADIPKLAVMASDAVDAAAVLAATARVRRAGTCGPLATMAMGAHGSITRLTGEAFGSALSFCALDCASAPGQVPLEQAKAVMGGLHGILGAE